MRWDIQQTVSLPGTAGPPRRGRRLVERLPRRALLVGDDTDAPTMVEEALVAASRAMDATVRVERAIATTGVLVLIADRGVVRVAIGNGRRRIQRQHEVLTTLHARDMADVVSDRLPRPLAAGRAGAATWSLERRLAGSPCDGTFTPRLWSDVVEFLIALHQTDETPLSATPCRTAARRMAHTWPYHAPALFELAEESDRRLVGLPGGFGHGDYWHHNLLVEDGRLRGVVDWDGAGPARLPLLDLMSLWLNATRAPGSRNWGPAIPRLLLPWANAGGDRWSHDYCRRRNMPTDPRTLRALVAAYWLDRVAAQIERYGDRKDRDTWVTRNVDEVLAALAS